MKIGHRRASEITSLVRAAVRSQIECWGFQSQIESELNVYFRNMEQAIADLAAAGEPETIEDLDVQMLIEGLNIEQ